ncbi:hypothetical protein NQ314_004158 [Rhamnusium bicolor]|uniref:Glucosidase II beta subunit N-terminal domain-containing protein n=1 Tax=Rhamnusium bicolor TaxID=1586634 RepID=A0AAV8ZND1_9CUCU|nr:hypothetical protein NQ314_004158 [Rhamnusium bicolor]
MNSRRDFIYMTMKINLLVLEAQKKIDFKKINDNYCDCLDGSDEPGTNACSNGIFYCTDQVVTKRFSKSVPSSKVNDGICDCCDGSDEWENNQVLKNLDRAAQKRADRFHVPCPKMC